MRISDWSSDVCSSDLAGTAAFISTSTKDTLSPIPRASNTSRVRRSPKLPLPPAMKVLPARSAKLVTPASARTRSEEHTSELQSLMRISSAVFCLKKKKNHQDRGRTNDHYNNKQD